jgi:hypothetical protein
MKLREIMKEFFLEVGQIHESYTKTDLSRVVFDLREDLDRASIRIWKIKSDYLALGELPGCQHETAGHAHVSQTTEVRYSVDRPADIRINGNPKVLTSFY